MSIAARALHGVNVCVIPNPDNEFKPLALRHTPLAILSALLITAKIAAIGIVGLIPAQAELSTITSDRIVQLTNAEREKVGLGALSVNPKLTAAAEEKGKHMLAEDYFSHISPSGVTPWFWIQQAGYTYLVAGENLAINFTEAEDVVAAWLASPTHKANILQEEYVETGVAAVTGEFQGATSIVVVHMFGKPSGGTVQSETVTTTPTPTPAPTSQPSPTPPAATPLPTPPPDTDAPPVPRIALEDETGVVGTAAGILITGEPGSITVVLIEGREAARITLSQTGRGRATVDLSNYADGTLVLAAYSVDAAGNRSASTADITLAKDTVGPDLAASELVHLIAPAFDSGNAAVLVQSEWVASSSTGPFTVEALDELGNKTTLADLSIAPQFEVDPNEENLRAPARVSQLVRRLTGASLATLIVLLLMTVFIRIRIQHPALITHTAAVMVLAAILLLV